MKTYFLSLLLVGVFLTGCTQKVTIQSLAPAKVDRATTTKKIAVMPFDNDKTGLSSKIEVAMTKKIINGKSYFTIISRTNTSKILEEQRLQYSGLINESTAVELGDLIGVEAMITGNINDASALYTYYREKRSKCIDKKCKETRQYSVHCTKGSYFISAQIKMIDVQKGDIIYANTLNQSSEHRHCSDKSGGLPSKSQELNILSDYLSESFVSQLSPNIITFNVELLEDPDIDYTDEQEDLLENGLKYIEIGRYKKAEELFSKLLTSSNDKSYVAAYNLGVIKEIQSKYDHAQQLYLLADSLKLEPLQPIDKAVVRIRLVINNKKTVEKQINR
ncbi:MAG: hypothetical protein KAQ94_03925 [Arcobacteraceae bacterium]|nr:hypothetical protein [Arcobacteraceae bacterium]